MYECNIPCSSHRFKYIRINPFNPKTSSVWQVSTLPHCLSRISLDLSISRRISKSDCQARLLPFLLYILDSCAFLLLNRLPIYLLKTSLIFDLLLLPKVLSFLLWLVSIWAFTLLCPAISFTLLVSYRILYWSCFLLQVFIPSILQRFYLDANEVVRRLLKIFITRHKASIVQ